MSANAISPEEKRTLARRVGKDLNKHCGRKNFYQTYEVTAAMRRLDYPRERDSWALSLYVSPYDFGIYHSVRGESCDYAQLHDAMLASIEQYGPVTRNSSTQRNRDQSAYRQADNGGWSVLDLFDVFDSWDWPDFPD